MAATSAFRLGTALLRPIPTPIASRAGSGLARIARPLYAKKAEILSSNLARATALEQGEALRKLTAASLGSYGRYWAETFKMPYLSATEIDRGFSFTGLERIMEGLESGTGVIIALPHLGGWEWAAAWLGRVTGNGVTAVVESLEPPEVFEWFVKLRQSYDVEVVPLGPKAGSLVMSALARNRIVTLLSDRDISGTGIEVDLFGHKTVLPSGPALLALRAGVAILPTAVYFRTHDRMCLIDEPVPAVRRGRLRDDVARLTADLAKAMERLIDFAPEQWHVLEPLWTADAPRLATS